MSGVLNGVAQDAPYRLPMVKVGVGSKVELVLRCRTMLCLATHWIGGRTVLCASDGDLCPCCAFKQPRALCYTIVTARDGRGDRLALLEGTQNTLGDFFGNLGGKVVGVWLQATRPRAKCPLRFEVLGVEKALFNQEIDGFRLFQALAGLYCLPMPRPGRTALEWMADTLEARTAAAEFAVRRVD